MGRAPEKSAKWGMGALSNVTAFIHERTPMSCSPRVLSYSMPSKQVMDVQWRHQWVIPTLSIPTLSIPTSSIPIWSTSHFVNSHFVNSHLVNVDKAGIDKVGIDEVGS